MDIILAIILFLLIVFGLDKAGRVYKDQDGKWKDIDKFDYYSPKYDSKKNKKK